MPITVKVKETGLKKTKKTFRILENRLNDFNPVWKDFIKFYQNETIEEAFKSQGSSMGEKWQSYSPFYIKILIRNGQTLKETLRRKGTIDGKVHSEKLYKAAKGGSGWYEILEKQHLEFGLNDPFYAAVHQFGLGIIPRRVFFFTPDEKLNSKSEDFLENLTNDYLDERNLK